MSNKEKFLKGFLGEDIDLSKLKSCVTQYRPPKDLTKDIGDDKLEFFIEGELIKSISKKDFKRKYEEFIITNRNKSIDNLMDEDI